MKWRVRLSVRPSKIVESDKPLALFVSMIAVFYDDAVIANGYGRAIGAYLSHFGRCHALHVKLNR